MPTNRPSHQRALEAKEKAQAKARRKLARTIPRPETEGDEVKTALPGFETVPGTKSLRPSAPAGKGGS